MPPFAPTYSEEQRTACAEAYLDDDLSAPAVAELARAGNLRGLPAFDPKPDTIRVWARHVRRGREGVADRSQLLALPPTERRDWITQRLAAAVEREVAAIARSSSPTAARVKAAAEAWTAVERLLEQPSKHGPGRTGPGQRSDGREPQRSPESFLGRLERQEARGRARTTAPLLPPGHDVDSVDQDDGEQDGST